MPVIIDYHMHTPLCGHAEGEPSQYAKRAIKIGLEEIGFSDHAPMVTGPLPGITMDREQLPDYYQMMEDVRDQYKNELRIKIGIEADFIPGYEKKTKTIIDDYSYDYVIGSVHFIKDWGFDNPDERAKWDQHDVNQVYRDYYGLLRQSAKTGFYNIIGHCDLVKKFGRRPTEDMTNEVQKTAQVFKECGVAIEINTSGKYKEVNEMYPALWNLEIYAKAGLPLTFGSDAHQPEHVGRDFNEAAQLAKQAGFSEYVLFRDRQIERSVKL